MHRRCLLGLTLTALAGCGFKLRGTTELPFRRLALTGFAPRSPMAEQIARALPADTQLVTDPRDAEVAVQALEDRYEKTAASLSAVGQVRELRMRVRLRFRILHRDGRVLREETVLEQTRDLTYSETAALAKENEEAILVQALQADIAARVVQMLAAVDVATPAR